MPSHATQQRPPAGTDTDVQERVNARMWARRDLVGKYANRNLRPAEVTFLVRYRDEIGPRVLELGCGAGRLTGYLAELFDDVHGIDVNSAMLEHCARAYPKVHTALGDMTDLSAYADASFQTVIAAFNVVDVLTDESRRALLDEVHRILAPDGLFLLCAHNLAAAGSIPDVMKAHRQPPLRAAITLARLPRWLINRRRVRPLERRERDYAVLNDVSHDFAGLHYYIDAEGQERQLAEHGFEVLEILDREGRTVAAADDTASSSDLHYVARPGSAAA